jgi:hypothetical protein
LMVIVGPFEVFLLMIALSVILFALSCSDSVGTPGYPRYITVPLCKDRGDLFAC